MLASTDPTSADLKKGLTDVEYEIDQMYEAYLLCKDGQAGAQATANAYLESFLLHVRCLWEFYAPQEPLKRDTINALEHYCFKDSKLWEWFNNHEDLHTKLHKRLAHLTFSRPSPSSSDREWPTEKMFEHVSKYTEQFIEHLLQKPDLSDGDEWKDCMKKLSEERSSDRQSQYRQEVRDTDSLQYLGR